MGNVRNLKGKIDTEIYGLIADCFASVEVHPEAHEVINKILEEAVELRNSLVHRTNHRPEKVDSKTLKAHYAAIKLDLEKETDRLFQRLSSVSAKKKK
jgi:uncharacterized protein YutE (UPF0331/DUF86 family)